MAQIKVGTRLRCEECGSEVIVIKATAGTPECCGQPMQGPEEST